MANGYDPAQCAAILTPKGFVPTCDPVGQYPWHCVDFMETPLYHQSCGNQNMYSPVIDVCCQNATTKEIKCFPSGTVITQCQLLHQQDPAWDIIQCYCCCGCFAYDTLVAVPGDKTKEIYTIAKGDEVLVANLTSSARGVTLAWSSGVVTFSTGTGPGGLQPLMVYLVYNSPDGPKDVVCSPSQPFLLPDGTLTLSQKLQPGDQLVDKDGNPVTLALVSIGSYVGGVHHIAVGADFTGSPDGHLILAGGLVAGDYDLQSNFPSVPSALKSARFEARPSIGTAEYETLLKGKATPQEAHVVFAMTKPTADGPGSLIRGGKFKAYRSALASPSVPDGAQSLFTPAQAADILANGAQIPVSNPLGYTIFNLVKKHYAGFYPDINFAYDPLNLEPNLYAYDYFGQKYVLLSGGLARLIGFNYEGIMMAMGWGIACFDGGPPQNFRGFSAIGQADYYAFGTISRNMWSGTPWMTYVQAAMNQWQFVFGLITPANAGGNPADPLNDPSIACRWQAIQMGFAGASLPECAGGPPLPKLALEAAAAATLTQVKLVFSIALTSDSGSNPANYSLTPAAAVTAATVDPMTGFRVTLTTNLDPNTNYTVRVANLESYIGTGLDPNRTTAQFTSPKT
jgi:hypothetical protein